MQSIRSGYSAPSSFAPRTHQPALAAVKFGIVEIGKDKYDQAKALFDAGIHLAKAGDGTLAAAYLNKALAAYDTENLKMEIINAFASGVAPGLQPNPERADELMEELRKQSAYRYAASDDKLAAIYAEKLAPLNAKYAQKAIELYEKVAKGYNNSTKLFIAAKLAQLGEVAKAKAMLVEMLSPSITYESQIQEKLSAAKILGGIEEETKPNMFPHQPNIPEVVDGPLAGEFLKKLGLQSALMGKVNVYAKEKAVEILNILALGKGQVPQSKEAAKSIIDAL